MSDTISVRLPDELLKRLRDKCRRTGLPVNRVVREAIENSLQQDEPVWMKYAGTLSGPRNLSSRKGYSRS